MSGLTPINSETLADKAYRHLCEAIVAGQFKPGEKLTIRGLAADLQISPTPIRDALRRLATERVVDFEPNRYISIPKLTVESLRELRDVRMNLEGIAAERAAQRIDPATLAELRALDTQIRALRASGDVKATTRRIQQLHFRLYRAAGMPLLEGLIHGLWLRTAPNIGLLFPVYSEKERGTMRGLMLEALERGDGRSARRFIEADICGAMDYIIDLYKEAEAADPPAAAAAGGAP